MSAKKRKQIRQSGMKPRRGRKMGVPAQTMVSMLTEMVLNLTAGWVQRYLIFRRCRGTLPFRSRTGSSLRRSSCSGKLQRRG